jgi:hypothetical protein
VPPLHPAANTPKTTAPTMKLIARFRTSLRRVVLAPPRCGARQRRVDSGGLSDHFAHLWIEPHVCAVHASVPASLAPSPHRPPARPANNRAEPITRQEVASHNTSNESTSPTPHANTIPLISVVTAHAVPDSMR